MLQLAQRQSVHLADVQAQLLTSALQRVMAVDQQLPHTSRVIVCHSQSSS